MYRFSAMSWRGAKFLIAAAAGAIMATAATSVAAQSIGTRLGPVGATSSTAQSYLRFFNANDLEGTVEVDLLDPTSGTLLATWTGKVARYASPQFGIRQIESQAKWSEGASRRPQYTIAARADFPGRVQHVSWDAAAGVLTNLSSCGARQFTASRYAIDNFHSPLLAGNPSYLYVSNLTASEQRESFYVYDSAAGTLLGQFTTAAIAPNGVLKVTATDIAKDVASVTRFPHLNLVRGFESRTTSRHYVDNERKGILSDMTDGCFLEVAGSIGSENVSAVPASFGIDGYYRKFLNAGGVPIVSSNAVTDRTLRRARQIVLRMVKARPDILLSMIQYRAYVAIVGQNETAATLPVVSDMMEGASGTLRSFAPAIPSARVTLAAEENLLELAGDTAGLGENTLIREFAKAMYTQGIVGTDASLTASIDARLAQARTLPIYAGSGAINDARSYWAESLLAYFGAKRSVTSANVLGHEIRTRSELQSHDPGMHALLVAAVGEESMPALAQATVSAAPVLGASLVTPAAKVEQARLCAAGTFPAQWEWAPESTSDQPAPATSGTPKIEQVRDGKVIAIYTHLGTGKNCSIPPGAADDPTKIPVACGPFARSHTYRSWKPGDVFLIYPAVYSGPENQPWIGPVPDNPNDYNTGKFQIPTGLTLRGVTVNGVRPVLSIQTVSSNNLGQGTVYLDKSKDIVIENIDIDAEGATSTGKGLIYANGVENLTLRDMRIHGASKGNANGVFGTPANAGTIKMERIDIYNNGGDDGPAHNIYINDSETDPNFTVEFLNSWSHRSTYGHLLKSRAKITRVIGSYLSGSVPDQGIYQGEPYLIDVPNGGRVTVKNSILVKNASGRGSNGILLAYAMEYFRPDREHALTVENNTFVTFSKFYDGERFIYPFNYFYPASLPGTAGFPAIPIQVRNNVFAGFCSGPSPGINYRGDLSLTVGLDEINRDFSLKSRYSGSDTGILGSSSYEHRAGGGKRTAATIGARD